MRAAIVKKVRTHAEWILIWRKKGFRLWHWHIKSNTNVGLSSILAYITRWMLCVCDIRAIEHLAFKLDAKVTRRERRRNHAYTRAHFWITIRGLKPNILNGLFIKIFFFLLSLILPMPYTHTHTLLIWCVVCMTQMGWPCTNVHLQRAAHSSQRVQFELDQHRALWAKRQRVRERVNISTATCNPMRRSVGLGLVKLDISKVFTRDPDWIKK